MAKMQLTNLPHNSQIATWELPNIIGGFDRIQKWVDVVLLNENTADGAINTAILRSLGSAKLAGDVNKTGQLEALWKERVRLSLEGKESVFQVIAPL